MKKVILILILSMLLPATLLSGSYSVVFPGGQKRYVKTVNLGGSEYLKFGEFKKVFLNESIKAEAYPASFFIKLKTADSLKLIQLRRPTVEYRGETYIPFVAMAHAIDAMLPLTAELKGNSLRLEFINKKNDISKNTAPDEISGEKSDKPGGLPDISAYRKTSDLIRTKERMIPEESKQVQDKEETPIQTDKPDSKKPAQDSKKPAKNRESGGEEIKQTKEKPKERELEPVPGRYVIPEGLKIREPG